MKLPKNKATRVIVSVCIALLALLTYQGCGVDTYEIKLTSIAVTPDGPSVPVGATMQFTATGTLSDNSVEDLTATATWKSSDTGVATIDSAGLATPLAAGTTTITASSGGAAGSTTLTVTNAVLQSITVTPATPSIAKGTTVQFKATGNYADASTQDLTTQVVWGSSDPSVTISAAGLATTTTAQASVTITATKDAFSDTATLEVKNVTLSSIAVTPADLILAGGTNKQYTATGTFSDASTQDLTAQVTWGSSNTVAATINSATGLARSLAAGVTNITATSGASLGSVPGSTTLTVVAPGGGC